MKRTFVFILISLVSISLSSEVLSMDVNGDGTMETVYFHPGKNNFYKIAFDFDQNGEFDICVLVDEDTGELKSLDLDRTYWPRTRNLGSPQWLEIARERAGYFWAGRGPQGNSVYDENGNFLFKLPSIDPSGESCVCDICNATVFKGEGYVLSSQDVFSNMEYVNRKDPLAALMGFDPVSYQMIFLQTLFETGSIDTPWMVCSDCITQWK